MARGSSPDSVFLLSVTQICSELDSNWASPNDLLGNSLIMSSQLTLIVLCPRKRARSFGLLVQPLLVRCWPPHWVIKAALQVHHFWLGDRNPETVTFCLPAVLSSSSSSLGQQPFQKMLSHILILAYKDLLFVNINALTSQQAPPWKFNAEETLNSFSLMDTHPVISLLVWVASFVGEHKFSSLVRKRGSYWVGGSFISELEEPTLRWKCWVFPALLWPSAANAVLELLGQTASLNWFANRKSLSFPNIQTKFAFLSYPKPYYNQLWCRYVVMT